MKTFNFVQGQGGRKFYPPQYDLPDLPQYHLPELRGRHTLSIPRIELKLHFVQNVESDKEVGQKRTFLKGTEELKMVRRSVEQKEYVWKKKRRRSADTGKSKDRRRKVVDGIIVQGYERRLKPDAPHDGDERRGGKDRRSGKERRK